MDRTERWTERCGQRNVNREVWTERSGQRGWSMWAKRCGQRDVDREVGRHEQQTRVLSFLDARVTIHRSQGSCTANYNINRTRCQVYNQNSLKNFTQIDVLCNLYTFIKLVLLVFSSLLFTSYPFVVFVSVANCREIVNAI